MVNYSNVSARAMLVSLHIAVWNAQRFDADVSREVTDRKAADASSGRFNKHLFGTRRAGRQIAPEFFSVLDAAEALRNLHDRETLPWAKRDGERLLPTANYMSYTDAVRKAGAAFTGAADEFVEAYPRLQVEAVSRLGKLYRDADFLPSGVVRRRFSWETSFMPVPSAGDIRVDLPGDQLSAI